MIEDEILRKITDLIPKRGLKRLLDIGCGDGRLTMILKDRLDIEEVYGVDKNEHAIERARKFGVKAFICDVDKDPLPFDCEFFDIVTMIRVIEHLINPDNAIKEAYRVTKPDGILIIVTPNQASYFNRILLLFGYPILGLDLSTKVRYKYPFGVTSTCSGHVRLYTFSSLKMLLQTYGFKVKKIQGLPSAFSKTEAKGLLKLVKA